MTASPEFSMVRNAARSEPISPKPWNLSSKTRIPIRSYPPWCIWTRRRPICTFCFVPLTEDKRLSAKEIVGNKKKADLVAG